MAWILLTNDDGADSPALVPFARALGDRGEVRVVVPDRERSWVGKAVTRHEPIHATRIERDGLELVTCTGYPADAVQLAIHAIFGSPPSLLISGINIGYNHGAGFLMSSGTVGAAIEGWISGVPSFAVSTGTLSGWEEWKRMVHDPSSQPAWERTAAAAATLVSEVLSSGLMDHADVVSINLPFDPPGSAPRRLTSIAPVGYDRLFEPDGDDRFVHAFGGGFRRYGSLDGSDISAAQEGAISITPLLMPQASPVPEAIRMQIEQPST